METEDPELAHINRELSHSIDVSPFSIDVYGEMGAEGAHNELIMRRTLTPIPIHINSQKGGTVELSPQTETQLDEYTHNHSLAFLHNISEPSASRGFPSSINELDNLCIRSNSPFLLHSKNNSNNNSDGSGSDGSDTDVNSIYSNHFFRKKSNSPKHKDKERERGETKLSDGSGSNDEPVALYTPMYLDKIDHNYSRVSGYKKLTYKDVVKSLSHYYDDCNKYSNEMDILITYIRGQKNLYSQSSTVTFMKLYFLLFFALCITAFVTIVTPFIGDKSWSVVLITTCNAIATFIISATRYLKLEFTGNAYSFLANNYEKFENSLEIANNKMAFITNESEQNKILLEKIKELEFKIGEMKDIFQVIIPNEVKVLFPVISHINIFSLIKKMESHKTNLIMKFRDIKNEINYIIHIINQRHKYDGGVLNAEDMHSLYDKEKQRVLFLTELKDNIKTELVNYKDAYNQLDYLFTKEIQFAETHISMVYFMGAYYLCFGRPKYLNLDKYSNSVIQDYLKIILYDD